MIQSYSMIKVSQFENEKGVPVKNQFFILCDDCTMFQSYKSIIAKKMKDGTVYLDSYYWDYSKTTSKYRNLFLRETTKETQEKIYSGVYKLVNLN